MDLSLTFAISPAGVIAICTMITIGIIIYAAQKHAAASASQAAPKYTAPAHAASESTHQNNVERGEIESNSVSNS